MAWRITQFVAHALLAVAVQSDLAQAGYSKALDQSRKITDLTTKLVEETSAPIAKQVTITVEKFAKPLAA